MQNHPSSPQRRPILNRIGLLLSVLLPAAFASSAFAAPTTLLNETFSSTGGALSATSGANAGVQSLPTSATWFLEGTTGASGATGTYTSGSPGSLLLNNGSASSGTLAYFMPSGSPQTLN